MKIFAISLVILLNGAVSSLAQTLNQINQFGELWAYHTGLMIRDTSIFVVGGISDTSIRFSKIDAFIAQYSMQGHILDHHILRDSGKTFTIPANSWIETLDGNFVTWGRVSYYNPLSDLGFMMKISPEGEKLLYIEFGNYPAQSELYQTETVVNLPDSGFLVAVDGYPPGRFDKDIYLYKLSQEGNIIWRKTLGDNLFNEVQYILPRDNYYLLCTTRSNKNFPSVRKNYIYQSQIWGIDSAGQQLFLDTIPGPELNLGIQELIPVADGGLVYVEKKGMEYPSHQDSTINAIAYQYAIAKMDSNRNPVWETRLDTYFNFIPKIHAITETADGGILAVGENSDYDEFWGGQITKGWLTKLNANGDSLWTRYFRPVLEYSGGYTLQDIGTNANGEIIMVGSIDTYVDSLNELLVFAWLLKTDEYGCLVPGCHTVNLDEYDEKDLRISLFPNPAKNHLYVHLLQPQPNHLIVSLRDLGGRLLRQQKGYEKDITYIFNTASLARGLYLIQVTDLTGRLIQSEKVLVH